VLKYGAEELFADEEETAGQGGGEARAAEASGAEGAAMDVEDDKVSLPHP
jgi:hypothetical protein